MQLKKIFLRKPLTSTTLKYHLKRFFKVTTFTSRHIILQTKYTEDKKELSTQPLGKYVYINLDNKSEITNHIDYLITEYINIIKPEIKIYLLIFNFIGTNKKEYEKYLNELSQINPFKYF